MVLSANSPATIVANSPRLVLSQILRGMFLPLLHHCCLPQGILADCGAAAQECGVILDGQNYRKKDPGHISRGLDIIGSGASVRIRTGDLRITSALLYQLSYAGLKKMAVPTRFELVSPP